MRTMASVWFSVIVLVAIQKAFGDVCLKDNNKLSCNECIRCGGDWCNDQGLPHCVFSLENGWCPKNREILVKIHEVNTPGVTVKPSYSERTLHIVDPNKLDIHFVASAKPKIDMKIVNTTQNFNIVLKASDTKCSDRNCTTTIEAMPLNDFCSATSKSSEFVCVKINVGSTEEIIVKYHVPCACECSLKVENNSKTCHNNGDLSCGVCTCHSDWTGEFCETPICPDRRGDLVQCSVTARDDAECSGNGYCGPCESCVCYTDREGSQYFDQENNCEDLCMVTNACDECLSNNTIGECESCTSHHIRMERFNQSLMEERDAADRKIWVSCNVTNDDCLIDYFAKRSDDRIISVMVKNSCQASSVAYVAGPKVPIILGVLGIIAAVAAVAGVMLWKHLNTVPPVPLNDSQYQNIDAEDCTGENPLYKPATSSYKNPLYGKW